MENVENNSKPILDCMGRKIVPTQNANLLVFPFGTWEIEAINEKTQDVYIINGPGTLICNGDQLRIQ